MCTINYASLQVSHAFNGEFNKQNECIWLQRDDIIAPKQIGINYISDNVFRSIMHRK